ncbi:MAG TPA: 5-oxoprolinase subunit PxpA [Terrimicrobiaceae bacterium]|nr:5-oxoprolinase subunit PxpA [Terrimicrobiaceae bacterium]
MRDLNCDLGEGEAPARTRALLRVVTSANIACGGHAGDARSMRRCLRLCREFGVRAGAHPGYVDREFFGRRSLPLAPAALEVLLAGQTGALARIAESEAVALSHVKLHGALYHVVERDPVLARIFAEFVGRNFPRFRILAAPDGEVVRAAASCGVAVWREIFADRAYSPGGGLVSRDQPGAVLTVRQVRARLQTLRAAGLLAAEDGTPLRFAAETLCVHADSPQAVRIAKLARPALSPGENPR